MKIHTKTGDAGQTSLFGGQRVPKYDLRVEAYGTIDEVNSHLGAARAAAPSQQADTWLEQVQNQLFHLGSDLATPLEAKADWIIRLSEKDIAWLEGSIDGMSLPVGAAQQLYSARRHASVSPAACGARRLPPRRAPYRPLERRRGHQ